MNATTCDFNADLQRRIDERDKAEADAAEALLKGWTDRLYRHLPDKYEAWGYSRRLRFTDRGSARMAATVGWLAGLYESGRVEWAEVLAKDLDRALSCLSGYGGDVEDTELNPYPQYKIVLSDDGCFGSFGILWYRAMPNDWCHEKMAEKCPDVKGDDYYNAFQEFKRGELRINEDLEEWRCYKDKREVLGMYDRELIHYGFAFNGGLIYHFNGDVTDGSWSTHT